MRKNNCTLVLVLIVLVVGCSTSTYDEYMSQIDYSCNVDQDCTVKDVHNCCGYYPSCVNVEANVDPDTVQKACEDEGLASICGSIAIERCVCENNECKAISGPESW